MKNFILGTAFGFYACGAIIAQSFWLKLVGVALMGASALAAYLTRPKLAPTNAEEVA